MVISKQQKPTKRTVPLVAEDKGGRNSMRIAIGSDHGGFRLKKEIIQHLKDKGIEYTDLGTYDE